MRKKTEIYPHSPASIAAASRALQEGKLVSFPTETVYGLGANAFDREAINRVFATKGRPKQDPLIVHVPGKEEARRLVRFSGSLQESVFSVLCEHFWPGPLTLVLPANEKIPEGVTSGTGWVGLRAPRHPVALQLLREVDIPVVAPSANLFGHISPTLAQHVFADFHDKEVFILDGGQTQCGIESTVVKIEEDKVVILRPGIITPGELEAVLSRHLESSGVEVVLKPQYMPQQRATVSPGQHVRHYSPTCPCFLVKVGERETPEVEVVEHVAILDFNRRLVSLRGACLSYFDLSETGDPRQASFHLFQKLREAESMCPTEIWLADLTDLQGGVALGLKDRAFRAASGRKKALTHCAHTKQR